MNAYILGAVFIVAAPLLGGLLSGLDRVFAARMQGRQGPPVVQPFYDLSKLFQKRANIVNRYQALLVFGHLVFAAFTAFMIFSGGDILLTLFCLTLSEVFLCMTASSANGPYSSMSSQRELMQIMCVEPMLLLMAIGYYLATGSFMISDFLKADTPAIVKMPGFFVGFLVILIVELRKSPFDISSSHHAHQEMVKGITTDISGNIMGMSELAEWYEVAIMFAFSGLFFIDRHPISILFVVLAALAVFFFENLVDNVFPRVKWEIMFRVCWGVSFVAGGANLFFLLMMQK
ncbi:MAG: NADH-quinone oxidoreductase subunit H [Lachnospiraceae bacterium]|jgi:ech hydrogenase subunit B|nr:NADH-quinone oxidoreductase subunit H [Lachnospiraceae bacterium]